MIKLIPTLLLIPVCSLPVGVAYSAAAPAGTVRIAAISAPDAPAPAQAQARAPGRAPLPHLLVGYSNVRSRSLW